MQKIHVQNNFAKEIFISHVGIEIFLHMKYYFHKRKGSWNPEGMEVESIRREYYSQNDLKLQCVTIVTIASVKNKQLVML